MKKSLCRPSSIIPALLLFVLAFSSCMKKEDHTNVPATGIAFIHASPQTGKLDFVNYDNNYLLARLPYNTSAVYPATDSSTTPYRAFFPGYRTVGIALAGSNYFLNIQQLSFSANKLYSVFAIDTADKTTLLKVEDSLKSLDKSKVSVRFINLSPDSKKLELMIGSSAAPLSEAKAFKEYTGYYVVEPSDNYTLTVRETANRTVNVKRENVALKKGGIYTIWARGLEKATDSTRLNISVMKTK